MKRLLLSLVILSMVSISLESCIMRDKKVTKDNLKNTNVPEAIKDTYHPGLGWELDWADEFENDTIDKNNWNFQVEDAGRFNEEWQRYTNSNQNAYIENNCLVIKAIHESDEHGMNQYTSARLNTANKQTFKYGKIAARIKLPHGPGIWPAFWMLGANIDENGGDTPWPLCGEIDILELYGSRDDAEIEANFHYANKNNSRSSMGGVAYKLSQGKFSDAFHVFELEWDEDKFTWYVDGEQFASMPITSDELSEAHKEYFLLLNIAVGGTYSGRPNDNTVFPQHMLIDWIRVYHKK